jgi:hypothetical protein
MVVGFQLQPWQQVRMGALQPWKPFQLMPANSRLQLRQAPLQRTQVLSRRSSPMCKPGDGPSEKSAARRQRL